MGDKGYGIDSHTVDFMAREIKDVFSMGIQLAVVIGGGNISRGVQASLEGMERASADYMGMVATVINALALQNSLEKRAGTAPRERSFDAGQGRTRCLCARGGFFCLSIDCARFLLEAITGPDL